MAFAGAVVAYTLRLPLGFIIGPSFAVLIARRFSPQIYVPLGLRNMALALAGVSMGMGVPVGSGSNVGIWLVGALAIGAFVPIAAWVLARYLQRFGGFDPVSARLAAQPGGILVMLTLCEKYGGDGGRVLFVHALRILVGPLIVAWALQLFGSPVPEPSMKPLGHVLAMGAADWFGLAGASVAGWLFAQRLRLPGGEMLGPMFGALLINQSGWIAGTFPAWPLLVALGITGAAVGAAFPQGRGRRIVEDSLHALVGLAWFMILGTAFGGALHCVAGVDVLTFFLAAVPSGLSEMAAVAWLLGLDATLVAVLATWRFVLSAIVGDWTVKCLTRIRIRHDP